MKGLGRKTREGISWTILGSVASNVTRLVVVAILGRTLLPADFGVVAAAMTIVQLGNALRDLGVGLALVQRKDLEPEHVQAAMAFSLVLGLLLALAIFAGAEQIGRFFDITKSVPLVRMLSVLFVLRGASLVSQFLCRRAMSFRALALIDIAGYLSGAVLSIVLSLLGFGAWSIAWGHVLETSINLVLLTIVARPPVPRLRWKHLRDLLGFGLGQSLANLANYFANQGDYMVVGHVLGPKPLGLYQRAYDLVRFPATVFTNIAGSVLFSAFAKVQDDPARLGRAFRRSMFACAIVILPMSAGMIVLAPECIRILLGSRWGEAVWPFRIMCTTMLFRTTYKLGALVGRSSGEVFKIAAWQVVYAICVIGGAAISIEIDGILGVSCTTAASIVVVFFGLSSIGLKTSDMRARELVQAHLSPIACGLLVGGAAWAVATVLRDAGAAYYVVAMVTTAAGVLVFAGYVALGIRRGRGDWPWLVDTAKRFVSRRKKKKQQAAAAAAASEPDPEASLE